MTHPERAELSPRRRHGYFQGRLIWPDRAVTRWRLTIPRAGRRRGGIFLGGLRVYEDRSLREGHEKTEQTADWRWRLGLALGLYGRGKRGNRFERMHDHAL